MNDIKEHTAGFLEAIQYAAKVAEELGAKVTFLDKEYEKDVKRDDEFHARVTIGEDSATFKVGATPDRSYSRYNVVNEIQIEHWAHTKFLRRVRPETPLSAENKAQLKAKVKEVFDQTKFAVQNRITSREIDKKEAAYSAVMEERIKEMGFKRFTSGFSYVIYGTDSKNASFKVDLYSLKEADFFKLLKFFKEEMGGAKE